MPQRPSHAFAFLIGFWLGLTVFLPLAAPPAFSNEASPPVSNDPPPVSTEPPPAGSNDVPAAVSNEPPAPVSNAPPAARAPEQKDAELAALESALFEAVNRYRAEHHKIPLVRRADVDRVARAHSADMAARGFFSHETPEGRNWVDRLNAAGVDGFTMAGENVGVTTKPSPNDEILQGWIHSPVHRENLLAAPYNTTGLGIARRADGALFYTQLYLNFPRE